MADEKPKLTNQQKIHRRLKASNDPFLELSFILDEMSAKKEPKKEPEQKDGKKSQ